MCTLLPSRRRAASIACVALLASGLLACKNEPTAPRLATRYTLDRVNGSALPVALSSDPSDHTVLSGSLHFRSDGRVARLLRVRTSYGSEESYPDTLAYSRRGTRVAMVRPASPADTIWGTVGARSFEFQVPATPPFAHYRYAVAP